LEPETPPFEIKHSQRIRQKRLITILGIISIVVGVVIAIPTFLSEQWPLAIIASFLAMLGLMLLAVGLGD